MKMNDEKRILDITWRAVYFEDDGTISKRYYFSQYNDDGTENRYEDIDRSRLARFDIIDRKRDRVIHSVYLHPDQRLVFRRRNFIKVVGNVKTTMCVVGWVMNVPFPNGKSREIWSLTYLFPDGTSAVDNHRDNMELLPFEKY